MLNVDIDAAQTQLHVFRLLDISSLRNLEIFFFWLFDLLLFLYQKHSAWICENKEKIELKPKIALKMIQTLSRKLGTKTNKPTS